MIACSVSLDLSHVMITISNKLHLWNTIGANLEEHLQPIQSLPPTRPGWSFPPYYTTTYTVFTSPSNEENVRSEQITITWHFKTNLMLFAEVGLDSGEYLPSYEENMYHYSPTLRKITVYTIYQDTSEKWAPISHFMSEKLAKTFGPKSGTLLGGKKEILSGVWLANDSTRKT